MIEIGHDLRDIYQRGQNDAHREEEDDPLSLVFVVLGLSGILVNVPLKLLG